MKVSRSLWVPMVAALALLGASCRVNDPRPDQVIPAGFVTDELPDAVGVSYGPGAGRTLDVYQPSTTTSSVALIYLHSGGWVAGSKDDARVHPIPQWFVKQGHVVFSANYTLTAGDTSGFPANINDVKWAIAWANLASTKSAYGYQKVVVMGTSAGGHLAMLASTSSHATPPDMPAGRNVRPDAGMSFSAPIDITTWGAQNGYQPGWLPGFWGAGITDPGQIPLLARVAASPQSFVDAGDPPIFMSSGTADGLAPPDQNANVLEQRYIDVGPGTNKAWNDLVEGDGHNLPNANVGAAELFLAYLANGTL